MANRLRVLGVIVMTVGVGVGGVTSCSSPGIQEPEAVGQSAEPLALVDAGDPSDQDDGSPVAGDPPLTPVPHNHVALPLSFGFFPPHETSTTYVDGMFGNTRGRWITGWIAFLDNAGEAGWSYSDGVAAKTWHPSQISSPTQFGDPGLSACNDTFSAWGSDPTLAPVTDPSLSDGNRRALYAQVAATSGGTDTDVVVAVTPNGGVSWESASYATDSTTCGQRRADDPQMASNPLFPYDTFIVWDDLTRAASYLQRIWFTAPPGKPKIQKQFAGALPIGVPLGGVGTPWDGQRHRLGFITLPAGCTSGGEGVVLAFNNDVAPARCSDSMNHPQDVTWTIGIYDTGDGKWYGGPSAAGWTADSVTGMRSCLVHPFGGFQFVGNPADPSLATRPGTSDIWVATTAPTPHGNKVRVNHTKIVCSDGVPVTNGWTHHQTPEPCDALVGDKCTNGNNPVTGKPFVQDEWQPEIAFVTSGIEHRTAVAFYGTRNDVTNTLVGVYMMYSQNGGAWTKPQLIAFKDKPSETIPWAVQKWSGTGDLMWDYNQMGVAWPRGKLLAVWAGDGRNNDGVGLIETDLLQ